MLNRGGFGKFSPNTIRRTIKEEVGELNYDPADVKPLGLIKFDGLGQNVVAAPYLIPIKNKNCLRFNPQDEGEVDSPSWIPIEEITRDRILEVKGFQVPLYRSPMREIAEMVTANRKTPMLRIIHTQKTISQELINLL